MIIQPIVMNCCKDKGCSCPTPAQVIKTSEEYDMHDRPITVGKGGDAAAKARLAFRNKQQGY